MIEVRTFFSSPPATSSNCKASRRLPFPSFVDEQSMASDRGLLPDSQAISLICIIPRRRTETKRRKTVHRRTEANVSPRIKLIRSFLRSRAISSFRPTISIIPCVQTSFRYRTRRLAERKQRCYRRQYEPNAIPS